ncbi:MAG: NADH-quinone oxidoreductase subunit C [Verrucomicrobiales bacterium]|nr:NADH-quinone oxidoreductase subunit C [Verrucomicrobiales bacterium]
MQSLDQIKTRLETACPGARLEWVENGAPSAQHSLRVDREHLRAAARFLRDDPVLRLDYCSNVTGVDWPDRAVKAKVRRTVDGVEKEVEESRLEPGYLEVVYHLYSMAAKHGPVILRVRTPNRSEDVSVPSLTPVWRGCELQEREILDLYGVVFEGHPDPRRLLMWEGFLDHPMRKDYVEPDDYEYEPTPHDRVAERAEAHRRSATPAGGEGQGTGGASC